MSLVEINTADNKKIGVKTRSGLETKETEEIKNLKIPFFKNKEEEDLKKTKKDDMLKETKKVKLFRDNEDERFRKIVDSGKEIKIPITNLKLKKFKINEDIDFYDVNVKKTLTAIEIAFLDNNHFTFPDSIEGNIKFMDIDDLDKLKEMAKQYENSIIDPTPDKVFFDILFRIVDIHTNKKSYYDVTDFDKKFLKVLQNELYNFYISINVKILKYKIFNFGTNQDMESKLF